MAYDICDNFGHNRSNILRSDKPYRQISDFQSRKKRRLQVIDFGFHDYCRWSNGPKIVGLNFISELLSSFSNVFSTFAGTMAPVALISFTTQGVQPFAVMIMGILLTKFLPKTEKENITRKIIIRRTVTIILRLIGLACIEFG